MTVGRGRGRQLPLALDHVSAQTRDDLVVTPANKEAVALIDRWPDWPSLVAAIVGPPGSGKTHLGAIWRDCSGALELRPDRLAEAAVISSPYPPILVDDADGPTLDEVGLFHLLNASRAAGAAVLLTARRTPLAWEIKLPDLASRLKTAALAEIWEPDDALLQGVLAKLFADRQIEVEPHVVQFLVRRMERSLVSAIGLVEELDRLALERKSRITRTLAAQLFDGSSEDAEAAGG